MGAAGIAVTVVFVYGAFQLTAFQGGTTYEAAFSEAGGLKPREDVRIAGVKVGTVKSVGLEGDHVRVGFDLHKNIDLGTLTRARIKIATVLGSHYLDLQPSGSGRQSPHTEIPISRTTSAYDVVPALQDLSGSLERIDAQRLAGAFDALSQTLQDSPANVRGSLAGLRKISRAIAARDDSLSDLLRHSRNVSRLLADRSGDLASLVSDGSLLLREIDARREVIRSLLSGTVSLSQQVTAAVEENQATLHPALVQLHRVVGVLERDQGDLDRAIAALAPFVTISADGTGSGRWFDGYLQNLVPVPVSIRPSAGTRNPHPTSGGTLPLVQ
jgi:phospholipid/cholesterol/gamma-HCH transport system substrate-binding protein